MISKWSSRILLESHKDWYFTWISWKLKPTRPKTLFTLCFPSIDSQRWVRNSKNFMSSCSLPGARRFSPPVGQGKKTGDQNILSGSHGAVSTISPKLSGKRNKGDRKIKKIMIVNLLPKSTFFFFNVIWTVVRARVLLLPETSARTPRHETFEHFPEQRLSNNKLWVVRERNKCFLPIKYEQL